LFLTSAIAGAADRSLAQLETVRQIQSLTLAEAARGYSVHLEHARILYVDARSKTAFLLQATNGVAARSDQVAATGVRSGDVVTVDGVTASGEAAAMIVHVHLQVVAHEPLPAAPRMDLHSVVSGDYDSRWVAVEGTIKSVSFPAISEGKENGAVLLLSSGPDQVDVTTQGTNPQQLRQLIGAKIRLSGVVRGRYNERSLLVGIQIYAPDLSYPQVLENPVPDPFALPVRSVRDVNHINGRESGYRVHIQGVVTSTWGNQHLSIMDSERGMWVATEAPVDVKVGDLLDLAGFPAVGEYTAFLDQAMVRRIGFSPQPSPSDLSVSEALSGRHDAELIQMKGRLIQKTASEKGVFNLILAQDENSFLVVLPPAFPTKDLDVIQTGSLLQVRGVCVVHADGEHKPTQFNILVRTPVDIAVLDSPPWWTPGRAAIMAGALFATVFGVILWNVVLRRQVRGQTRLIQSQLEEAQALRNEFELAHQQKSVALNNLMRTQRELLGAQEKLQYQATHDALTGLWNRAAVLELFQRELDRSERTHSPLGILLLDIDHFKHVNDTHGHLAGDAVLKEFSCRLTESTRSYDVAGRYGGEEFLIILPGCGSDETLCGAERIREAIASTPFRVGEMEFPLTVSIGATVASRSATAEALLLSQADAALYSAKNSGRNQIVMCGYPVVCS
jgi:diguanylate cyclase (GGDEF)-like protein